MALEAQIPDRSGNFEVICNLPYKSLKRELADEELCRSLEPPNLTQGNGALKAQVGQNLLQ